jgi:hypothetical protein
MVDIDIRQLWESVIEEHVLCYKGYSKRMNGTNAYLVGFILCNYVFFKYFLHVLGNNLDVFYDKSYVKSDDVFCQNILKN